MVQRISQWRLQTFARVLFAVFASFLTISEAAASYNYPFLKKIYYAIGHRSTHGYPRNFASLFYDVDPERNLPRPACCDHHVRKVLMQKLDELEVRQFERIAGVVWNKSLQELRVPNQPTNDVTRGIKHGIMNLAYVKDGETARPLSSPLNEHQEAEVDAAIEKNLNALGFDSEVVWDQSLDLPWKGGLSIDNMR